MTEAANIPEDLKDDLIHAKNRSEKAVYYGSFVVTLIERIIGKAEAEVKALREQNERLSAEARKAAEWVPMIELVREFHRVFGVPVATVPTIPSQKVIDLRIDLIDEEFTELKKAFAAGDIVEVADALMDLHYVISGASLTCGLPENELFVEVHRSNMSKANEDGTVIRRPDGKILKSARYSPPNLKHIITAPPGKEEVKKND